MSQTKLEEIIVLFKKRHIELNPPATMEAVRKIEAQYRITLPQEYVSFIRKTRILMSYWGHFFIGHYCPHLHPEPLVTMKGK